MSTAQAPKCFLILSLDGGGIRGALQAKILERIEDSLPFLNRVDLIAGTSIGGINALCLAADYHPSDLVNLFEDRSGEIFRSRGWGDTISGIADEVFRANYDNDGLQGILDDLLEDKRLADLSKKVVVTSFDLDNLDAQSKKSAKRRHWKPKIFHNFDSPGNDGSQLAVDVALRTSAAPTFFPTHQGYIDGGVAANNPVLCAIGRAVKSGVKLEQIVVLSIGTGANQHYIEGDRLDWGFSQWSTKLMPMFMDGMAGISDYIAAQLLPMRYVRIHPNLPENVELDDVDRVRDLLGWAGDVDITGAVELLSHLPT